MDKKVRIQKIKDNIPKKFYFDPAFEKPDRNKILKDVDLCYKNTNQNNVLNCAPILKADQEYQIFRKLNYLKYRLTKITVGFKKSDVKPSPKPSKPISLDRLSDNSLKEIESLIKHIEETRNLLLKCNTRLVFKRVGKYHPVDSFERDEFFSNGYCHVLKAIDSFDFRKGFKFSTYCTRVLQSNLSRDYYLSKKQEEKLCIPEDNLLHDNKEVNYSEINCSYNKDFIKKMLSILNKDPRVSRPDIKIKILTEYYGVKGRGKKLKDLGEELKISKERVRQIKFDAIKYLNKYSPVYDPLC